MSIYLVIVLLILLIILLTVILNAAAGPFLVRQYVVQNRVKVSVLVPARNEEKNIGTCLLHLVNQDYPNFEIIVLDDQSGDRTEEIITEYVHSYKNIRLIKGKNLEEGWTGKNWACHQLSQHANGDIFIFADADTQHGASAISRTVGWMQKWDLGMLSAFPQQITRTFSEKLIVPVIDFFVYGLLPLWMTYFSKSPAFAAANGQWIAFTADTYLKIYGHEAVKQEIVEDVELSRTAKRNEIKTMTLAGTGSVFCRMYHSPSEVWHGFTKNFYGITGHNSFIFLLIEIILLVCAVLPFILIFLQPDSIILMAVIFLNLLIRTILALRFKHPLLVSILLHPVSILYAAVIGFNSYYQFHWGHFQWKNRNIKITKLG